MTRHNETVNYISLHAPETIPRGHRGAGKPEWSPGQRNLVVRIMGWRLTKFLSKIKLDTTTGRFAE